VRNAHFEEGAAAHYRQTRAVPSSSIPGVVHVPHAELPHSYVAHHSMLGPENDKHGWAWEGVGHTVIGPETPIKTGQPYVGEEHVTRYASRRQPGARTPIDFSHAGTDEQDNGSPRLLKLDGELWHVDGLHRAAAARQLGRSFKARVWDADAQARPSYGAAPTEHHSLIGHVTEGHLLDNDWIGSDTSASLSQVRDYHAELHATGVADHSH
jgi:hypothetical protein